MAGPVSVEEAIGRLRPGTRILLPPGCGEPTTLIDEIVRQAKRLQPLTLMGGLHLSGHPFCAPEHHGRLRWVTFHAMPKNFMEEYPRCLAGEHRRTYKRIHDGSLKQLGKVAPGLVDRCENGRFFRQPLCILSLEGRSYAYASITTPTLRLRWR